VNHILNYNESITKQNKRAEILNTSMDMFIRDGIHPLTMKAIAKECGISVRSLFYYYSTKDDLAVDIQIIALTKFGEITNTQYNSEKTAYENIKEYFDNFIHGVNLNKKIIKYIAAFDYYFFNDYPSPKYNAFLNSFKQDSTILQIIDSSRKDHSMNVGDNDPRDVIVSVVQSFFRYAQNVIYREKAIQSEDISDVGDLQLLADVYMRSFRN
jgi:AcrR family transcriptional regulator